jgi:phosphatidylserine/phosphatidylglycerophosphate/cardiolipin synthase-like enzyme
MSFATDPTIEAVRCVGNLNTDKAPAFPRAHNKFLVLFNRPPFAWVDDGRGDSTGSWMPTNYLSHGGSVWTGSFNFTKNSARSLENAVVIRNPVIVDAYMNEWTQIAAISEPLDWFQTWVAPQWRIGT